MKVSMIAAVAKNNVIGKDNDLLWSLPDDMKFFMEKTTGHHVIMGRKNYESIPKKYRPLPNRANIVMTRQKDLSIESVAVVHSLKEALDIARKNGEDEAFIIGGGEIYDIAMEQADVLYLTEVEASPAGDAFFPVFDRSQWKETMRTHHNKDDRHAYAFDFVTYERESL